MESPRQSESDTVEYWKKQAKHYEQKANDMQQELDEYTENSAQLEKELEASLLQVEKQNRDLDHQNQRLKNEIEMLKNKLDRSQHETNVLENELQALKLEQDKKALYIRELEQKNDDLERGQRVISESVSCIEALLNQAYERNAVLESEVDEVETLKVRLQRATDEARDLKQELKVVEKVPVHRKEDDGTIENALTNGHITNASRQVETETQTILPSPLKREINGNAMTPSARVSAINIVGDLLRKVGLERFLCRECGKIKCSCDAIQPQSTEDTALPQHTQAKKANMELPQHTLAKKANTELPQTTPAKVEPDTDDVEYRNPRFVRQNSGPAQMSPRPELKKRSSEENFARPTGDNGKLRRSFAVRSREGLENLLSFASIRNGPRGKAKLTVAR